MQYTPRQTRRRPTQARNSENVAHDRSHNIRSTADHTSSATFNYILKADANGLPMTGGSLDSDVADAVSKKHNASASWPVGSVFISVAESVPGTPVNPSTLLGFGTWALLGVGRTLVCVDSGDANINVAKETYGASTKTISAHSGTAVGDHASHTHTGPSHNHGVSAVTVAGESSHTHTGGSHGHSVSTTGEMSVATEAAHTHSKGTYAVGAISATLTAGVAVGTGATNAADNRHTHPAPSFTGSSGAGSAHTHAVSGSTEAGGTVATGAGSSHTHSLSGNTDAGGTGATGSESATLSHSVTQPASHSDLNVWQPSIAVYIWERTA